MKKKSKLLAASLLAFVMSGAVVAGGTYALFSDTTENNIVINTGNIKVTSEDSIVSYKTSETDYVDAEGDDVTFGEGRTGHLENGTLTLNGVLPGDGVQYKVSYNNESTLPFKYRIRIEVSEELKDYFDIEATMGEQTVNGSAVLQTWTEGDENTPFEDISVKVEYREGITDLPDISDAKVKIVIDVAQMETQTRATIGEGYEYPTLAAALEDTDVTEFDVANIPDLENGSVTINRPVHLRGVKGNKILINSNSKITIQGAITNEENLVVIEGLNFEVEDDVNVTNAITVSNDNVEIRNCVFTGHYDIGEGTTHRALEVSPGTKNLNFVGNTISHLRQVGYFGGESGVIANNIIDNTRGILVTHTSNYELINNEFANNATDICVVHAQTQGELADSVYNGKEEKLSLDNNGCYVDNQVNPAKAVDGTSDVTILDPSKLQQGQNLDKDNAFYFIPAGDYQIPYGMRIEGTDADPVENIRILGAGLGTELHFTGTSLNGTSGIEIHGNVNGVTIEGVSVYSDGNRSGSNAPLNGIKVEGLKKVSNTTDGSIDIKNSYIEYANVHLSTESKVAGEFVTPVNFENVEFFSNRGYGALAFASAEIFAKDCVFNGSSYAFQNNWKDDDSTTYPYQSILHLDGCEFTNSKIFENPEIKREGLTGNACEVLLENMDYEIEAYKIDELVIPSIYQFVEK